MPTPNAGESEKDYISRCIPVVLKEGTAKDNKQAAAICYSMWRRKDEKKAELSEFSLIIRSVGLNKKTGERYWKASTSDIFPDSYNDEMSLDLYNSFLEKIKEDVKPPEQFRSEAWDGGMPYVSVSHYREHSIAGDADKVYIDGAMLKANGTFRETPLGKACFDALCDDLYVNHNDDRNRVRVSIAFLDYKHQHKADGFMFERSEVDEPCPECIKERLERKYPGRVFLNGLLIHFAMTRVPVNQRTLMEAEVEKSMTTKKEDAASIIGEELAEELENKEESLIGKSEAIIIKSEDEPIVETVPEEVVGVLEYSGPSLTDVLDKVSSLEKSLADVLVSLAKSKPKKDDEEEDMDEDEKKKMAEEEKKKKKDHPLGKACTQLMADFDTIALMDGTTEDRLKAIQDSFNALGLDIRKSLTVPEEIIEASAVDSNDKLLAVLEKLSDKIDLMSQQRSQVTLPSTSVRAPRSINPALVPQALEQKPKVVQSATNPTPFLRSLIDKSVGLE